MRPPRGPPRSPPRRRPAPLDGARGGRRAEQVARTAVAEARRMYGVEKHYESFRIGDRTSFSKTITEADIVLFGAVSGDQYPLHVDEEYAKSTRFGRRVAHGMLSASMLSTVNGLMLQRPGGIYVEQNIRFRLPVFIGDTLTATSEVVELIPERRRLRCRTMISNQRGEVVIDGEAVLQKDPR